MDREGNLWCAAERQPNTDSMQYQMLSNCNGKSLVFAAKLNFRFMNESFLCQLFNSCIHSLICSALMFVNAQRKFKTMSNYLAQCTISCKNCLNLQTHARTCNMHIDSSAFTKCTNAGRMHTSTHTHAYSHATRRICCRVRNNLIKFPY